MIKVFCCILVCTISITATGQYKNIRLPYSNNCDEPSIAIDPKNPLHMVAGANFSSYWYSGDGGLNWKMGNISSPYGTWGDPVIMADTSGSFYYFHLSNLSHSGSAWAGTPGWLDRMVCQRMDQFSGSWNSGSFTGLDSNKNQDKPGVAYDSKRNKFYLAWTEFDYYGSNKVSDSSRILFSSSSDNGNNWSNPIVISSNGGDCLDHENTVEGAIPAVGPNGEVYVSWASTKGIRFKSSTDGGLTWPSTETQIATIPGGWDYAVEGLQRCNGLPFTACDLSNGPYKGTIYVNWTDKRKSPFDANVWICKSTDNGKNWSAPIQVNDDYNSISAEQFLSSMTIDQSTGYVYVLFYDRRNAGYPTETEVYMGVSKDGGASFQNLKVSQQPFTPTQSSFLGDYTGISAVNGVIRPIWTTVTPGTTIIMLALADEALTAQTIAYPLQVQPLYPNPFNKELHIPYTLNQEGRVTIIASDMLGRTLPPILSNAPRSTGSQLETIHPEQYGMSRGMYLIRIICGNSSFIEKGFYDGP